MAILTEYTTENTIHKNYIAPPGYVYEITDVSFVLITSGVNDLGLRTKYYDGELNFTSTTNNEAIFFYTCTVATQQVSYMHYSVPVRTKVIHLTRRTTTTFAGVIIINYKLSRASQQELLWEYIANDRK